MDWLINDVDIVLNILFCARKAEFSWYYAEISWFFHSNSVQWL